MMSSSEAARPADELPRAVPALWRTFRLGYRAEPRLLIGVARHDVADDAARRRAGAVDEATHRRHARRRSHDGAHGRRRPRRFGDGDLVPPAPRPAPATPLPRPHRHRDGGPHRPPPGVDRRPSSTRSARTTSIASPCCATSRSRSTTCSRRCWPTSAGSSAWPSPPCCSPRSIPALALLLLPACRRCDLDLAPGRRTLRPGVGGAARPHGPPPVRPSAPPRRRPRRCASSASSDRLRAGGTGARARGSSRCRRPLVIGGVADGGVGAVRRRLRGRHRVGGSGSRPQRRRCRARRRRRPAAVAVPRPGVGELGFLRGVWLDSSLRLTWLEDYAAGLASDGDGRRRPTASSTASASSTSRSATRAPNGWPSTTSIVDLKAGTVVAIVGENGAGKTTLVKLLAGMYRPTAGRITVDRRRRRVDGRAGVAGPALGRRLPGLLPVRAAGPTHRRASATSPASTTAAPSARRSSGPAPVDVVDRLPAGLDTQLGPTWDDGVEVSFGQWQKLALARGFMRDEPLVLVLDEPTAALDAETEHALFERYASAAHEHRRQRPHHAARLPPLLDRPDGRPDRRPRRRPRGRGRQPRRVGRPWRRSTPSCSGCKPPPTAEPAL